MAKGSRHAGRHHAIWRIGAVALSALTLLVIPILGPPAHAESAARRGAGAAPPPPDLRAIAERMNANTLTLVTGNPGFIFNTYGNDLAAVLNDGDELRILPVTSQGAVQNVRDVRFLRGIDLGFTVTNILGHYRRTGEIGNLSDKLVYITKISNDEIHVVTRSDVTSFEQLRGRKVNFNTKGSGSQLSAQDICRALNVDVEEVNFGPADAFEKLKNQEIAATILTSARPASAIASLKASDGYRLIPVPFVKDLRYDYLPSQLTSADYPNLITPGETVETIAAASVLIAYNWPKDTDRYRRVDKFVKAFFAKFAEFQKPPRHPKWRETNLTADVPGWKRFEGAEEILKTYPEYGQRQRFEQFLVERPSGQPLTERERKQLFEDFVKWTAQGKRQ